MSSGGPVAIHNLLLLDAKRQSFLHADHALAIVLCESSFEVFLSSSLLKFCIDSGIAHLDSGKGKGKRKLPVREFCETQSVNELIMSIGRLTGNPIQGGNEHKTWKDYVYEQRNKIIHRGIRNYDETDAAMAFQAVTTYISLIRKVLSH